MATKRIFPAGIDRLSLVQREHLDWIARNRVYQGEVFFEPRTDNGKGLPPVRAMQLQAFTSTGGRTQRTILQADWVAIDPWLVTCPSKDIMFGVLPGYEPMAVSPTVDRHVPRPLCERLKEGVVVAGAKSRSAKAA